MGWKWPTRNFKIRDDLSNNNIIVRDCCNSRARHGKRRRNILHRTLQLLVVFRNSCEANGSWKSLYIVVPIQLNVGALLTAWSGRHIKWLFMYIMYLRLRPIDKSPPCLQVFSLKFRTELSWESISKFSTSASRLSWLFCISMYLFYLYYFALLCTAWRLISVP